MSTNNLEALLEQRGSQYGAFPMHAKITQALKRFYRGTLAGMPEEVAAVMSAKWAELSDAQQEALDMQAHKDGRIFNGNHNFIDSWDDKAGYNKLVADDLRAQESAKRVSAAISRIPAPFKKLTPKSKKKR